MQRVHHLRFRMIQNLQMLLLVCLIVQSLKIQDIYPVYSGFIVWYKEFDYLL